jgi:glycosyltransferase involved in cell wall biosynthesis
VERIPPCSGISGNRAVAKPSLNLVAAPGISIVIPTRNRGGYLLEAVESVFVAPTGPLDVVVVDDGSTDNSVEELRRRYPRVKVVEGSFGNAARARNAGAAAAGGDLLGFLDSDDLMLAGKTSALVEYLRQDRSLALVHGRTQVITHDSSLNVKLTEQHARSFEHGTAVGLDYAGLAAFCAMYTSATVIRRSHFDSVGGFDGSLDAYEDWDLYLRLSLVGRLEYTAAPAAMYRVWPGNVGSVETARWTAHVAHKHLENLPLLPRHNERRVRFALHRRIAESQNVLGDRGATRRAALAAASAAPLRAAADLSWWRAFLRSVSPNVVLVGLRRLR